MLCLHYLHAIHLSIQGFFINNILVDIIELEVGTSAQNNDLNLLNNSVSGWTGHLSYTNETQAQKAQFFFLYLSSSCPARALRRVALVIEKCTPPP